MARRLTVRDLRLHWPEIERRLRREKALIVTRDGRPVATLSVYREEETERARWSASDHAKWLNKVWKNVQRGPSTDQLLDDDRGK